MCSAWTPHLGSHPEGPELRDILHPGEPLHLRRLPIEAAPLPGPPRVQAARRWQVERGSHPRHQGRGGVYNTWWYRIASPPKGLPRLAPRAYLSCNVRNPDVPHRQVNRQACTSEARNVRRQQARPCLAAAVRARARDTLHMSPPPLQKVPYHNGPQSHQAAAARTGCTPPDEASVLRGTSAASSRNWTCEPAENRPG